MPRRGGLLIPPGGRGRRLSGKGAAGLASGAALGRLLGRKFGHSSLGAILGGIAGDKLEDIGIPWLREKLGIGRRKKGRGALRDAFSRIF